MVTPQELKVCLEIFLGENFRDWLLLDEESRHVLEQSIFEYKKLAEAGKELFQERLKTTPFCHRKNRSAMRTCV